MGQHNVIVIGAGYAGVMAANRLASRPGTTAIQVTLINPVDVFVERIRLHEFAAGTRTDATLRLDSLLPATVSLVADTVTTIKPEHNEVITTRGKVLQYDSLVYALGSGIAIAPAGASSLYAFGAAEHLRHRLAQLAASKRIAVIGGGLAGIETAAECAQQYPNLRVTLYTSGELAPSVGPGARSTLRTNLRKLGVEIRENTPISPTADLAASISADEIIWCCGLQFPTLGRDSGLPVDRANRLLVTSTLQSSAYSNIFGAGDASIITTPGYEFHRPSCAAALPMGAHAADNLIATFERRVPQEFSLGYVTQSISVGRKSGVVQLVRPNDTPRAAYFRDRIGAMTKEAICRMTVRWMRNEGRKHRSFSWPRGVAMTANRTTYGEKMDVLHD